MLLPSSGQMTFNKTEIVTLSCIGISNLVNYAYVSLNFCSLNVCICHVYVMYMSCISVLSLLIGFPKEFLVKILSAMLTLRILSPLDFAVITDVCILFK